MSLLKLQYKVVSSAYMSIFSIIISRHWVTRQIANVDKKKGKGPRIDPCGTPVELLRVLDFALLYTTYCSLLHK